LDLENQGTIEEKYLQKWMTIKKRVNPENSQRNNNIRRSNSSMKKWKRRNHLLLDSKIL